MKKSMFLSEWKRIFKNKKILIPIIAVIFVPLMYSGMFLWAFLDPYDHLQDLPVAIVNEDTGATYEGKELTLGDELVEKLTENDDFHFTNLAKADAYKALENQDYYLLVEIPKDFSHNATTLMDDHPKKLQLKYVPNESYNFLSSQIGETAVKEIKSAISSEVTATYAETMFDKIFEVADGLEQASDGSGKINDGTETLKDGTKELKDNLATLAEKSVEFQDGVSVAASGTNELSNGATELASSMGQLTTAGGELTNASKNVQAGSNELTKGINEVHNGIQEMKENVPALVNGITVVKDGVSQFQTALPKQMAENIGGKLSNSVNQMNAGLNELNKGINNGLTNDLAPTLANGLSAGIASSMADELIATQEQQMTDLKALLTAKGMDSEAVNEIIGQLASSAPSKNQISSGLEQQLKPSITEGVNDGINATVSTINSGFSQYKAEVNKNITSTTGGLEKEIKAAVDPTFNKLTAGLDELYTGNQTLQAGVVALADGVAALNEGSLQLNNGQKQYVEKMEMFIDKFSDATSGANQLATGATELNKGMGMLATGSNQMTEGTSKLAVGGEKLDDGTAELYDGTKELATKLRTAADEASNVHANEDTYDMMGGPVKVAKKEINHVPNYGTGFAPYFISLGLFVGALLMTIVFNLNEPAVSPKNGVTWFLGKIGVLAIVGIIQALLVDFILLVGLGIEVKSISLFIFVSIITSFVFMTLIQFLVTLFGDPGRFIAIVILILQLTTSAGTFPLELIPKALQPFNYLLPMTYSVQAFKAVISSGDYLVMWQNIGILSIYMIAFAIMTLVYFMIKHKKNHHVYADEVA